MFVYRTLLVRFTNIFIVKHLNCHIRQYFALLKILTNQISARNSTGKKNLTVKSDPDRTLFIGRLNYKTQEKDLLKIFSKFGNISIYPYYQIKTES